jgi:DNA transposition AAA+ family ATPase
MDQHGLSQSQVARQAGMSAAVLSAYLGGTYRGNCEEVGRKLTAWRDGLAENEVAEGAIGRISAFAKTKVAAHILTALKIAKLGKMVSIVGPSGVGKTMALRYFMRSNTNVWYCQFSKDTGSVYSILTEIAVAVGIQEVPARPDIVRREIVARVERTRGVILCDEAQHLPKDGLEAIRSLHDRAGVGIVFCGHPDLADKIARLPQVNGRISAPLRIGGAKPADADALFNSWGLECKESRKFLREFANRPTGLRRIAAAFELATIQALGEDGVVSFDHIESAWAELEGSAQAV